MADAELITDAPTGTLTLVPNAPSIASTEQFLEPALVVAADKFFATDGLFALTGNAQLLLPPLVIAADATLPKAAVAAFDVIGGDIIFMNGLYVHAVMSWNELGPGFVSDADAFGRADVGWRVFAKAVTEVDAVHAVGVAAIAFIVPEVLAEDDVIDTYPFFLQQLTGGVPVPPPIGVLTGSLNSGVHLKGSIGPRRVLTGSIARLHLKGSMGRPVRLTGSLRHISGSRKR